MSFAMQIFSAKEDFVSERKATLREDGRDFASGKFGGAVTRCGVGGHEFSVRGAAGRAAGAVPWRGQCEVFARGTTTLRVDLQPAAPPPTMMVSKPSAMVSPVAAHSGLALH